MKKHGNSLNNKLSTNFSFLPLFLLVLQPTYLIYLYITVRGGILVFQRTTPSALFLYYLLHKI